ncbi:hypothetical protein IH980_02630 [Patescibacteria group bacterium]|nr:hypothetical protein [Patescibacteria group bacterium]
MLVGQALVQIPAEFEQSIWGIAKLFVLVGLLLYLAFAVVVIRQVQLMARTVTGELDGKIRAVAWVHFAFAVGIFLLALLFL